MEQKGFPRNAQPNFEPLQEWAATNELIRLDLNHGSGREVQENERPGFMVVVDYMCFDAETAFLLESTWESNEPYEYPLGGLIEGWEAGLVGMKEGGRRILVIPPRLAYGGKGGGHPKSGRTLVYLVDLLGADA